MALQLKLKLFLLLTTLSFCCQAYNNSTVKVVGLIHCTHHCGINNHSTTTTTNASNLGLDVFIICKARKSSETKTQGNGGVDEHGKFNVTLADPTSIDGCYAKLQSSNSSSAPNCPIQGPQTASLKILSKTDDVTKIVIMNNRPTTVIEFSPVTCQSAFFWPFPNLTFFASPPPPPEYAPPPQPPQNIASPVQPPEPSYDDPPSPSPLPLNSATPPPTPPPTYQNLPTPTASPQASPPLPETSPPLAPPVNNPVQSPTPPESPKLTPPPTPALSTPSLLPPAAGIETPPSRRRQIPIPRAPPIPRLPVTPSVPRKYFNAPKSKSKPPRYD